MRIYGKSGLRKMNKYQEPFNNIVVEAELMAERCNHKLEKDIDIVQELIDKATPKKPIPLFIPIAYLPYRCPICGTLVNHKKDKFNYCPKCGQAIDRSEEE